MYYICMGQDGVGIRDAIMQIMHDHLCGNGLTCNIRRSGTKAELWIANTIDDPGIDKDATVSINGHWIVVALYDMRSIQVDWPHITKIRYIFLGDPSFLDVLLDNMWEHWNSL